MFNNDVFIEQLLIKANPEIDDEALDLMVEDIKPVLFDRVMTNLASKLSDKQLQDFMKLIKGKSPEKDIQGFLNKEVIDYELFIEKVYTDFETMYIKEYKNFEKEME